MSPLAEITVIRLQDAYLCECGMITDSAMRCVCGNTHGLLGLSAVLNRAPDAEMTNAQNLVDNQTEDEVR